MDRDVKNFNVRLRTIRIWELAVGIIVTLILGDILMTIFPQIYDSAELYFIVVLLIGVLIFVWALRGTTGLDKNIESLFDKKIQKEILYVFIINLLFAMLVTYLISYVDWIMSIGDPSWISIWDVDSIDMDSSAIILDSIGAIIFAPVIEELVFRGILFNRLKIRVGITAAMIISSFIFAIGHEFGGITSAFIFGICMCMIYLKTDNILIPMAVHFTNNVVATVLNLAGIDFIISQMPWLIPSTILSLIGTVYLIKYVIQERKALKKQYT